MRRLVTLAIGISIAAAGPPPEQFMDDLVLLRDDAEDIRDRLDTIILELEQPDPTRPELPRVYWSVALASPGANNAVPGCGGTPPGAWTPAKGWEAFDHRAALVASELGDIGINLHNPGGVWHEHAYAFGAESRLTTMMFEQWLLMRTCPHESRRSLDGLVDVLDRYGFSWRAAYLGAPRCDPEPWLAVEDPWPDWIPVSAHCELPFFRAALAPLFNAGIDLLVFDAFHRQNSEDSPVWDTVVPYARDRWVLGTESLPPRSHEYVLDHVQVVRVQERALQRREADPGTYFTVAELQSRGIAVQVSVIQPPSDFHGDKWQWQYEHALSRLEEGEVDSVGAEWWVLIDRGFDMGPVRDALGIER